MSRSALLTLRILAVGGALTVLACQVVNQQRQANTGPSAGAAGDRGEPGASTPAAPTRISGTKSLHRAPGSTQSRGENTTVPPAARVHAAGTKSARMVTPADVAPRPAATPLPTGAAVAPSPLPQAFPGTKSMRVMTAEDLRKLRQSEAEVRQQSPAPQP